MNNTTVDDWNKEIVRSLLPNIIVMSVLLFLGFFGNAFVALVYKARVTNLSDERYFIPILAVADLIASVLCSLAGILLCVRWVNFTDNTLCKGLSFSTGFTTYLSVFGLWIIALQRYFKVCKPKRPQMTVSLMRRLLALTIFISFMIAIPLPFMYGIIHVKNIQYGVTGSQCGKLIVSNDLLNNAYGIMIGLLATAIITSLIFFYSTIGHRVYHHFKITKGNSSQGNQTMTKVENTDEFVESVDECKIPVNNNETHNELSLRNNETNGEADEAVNQTEMQLNASKVVTKKFDEKCASDSENQTRIVDTILAQNNFTAISCTEEICTDQTHVKTEVKMSTLIRRRKQSNQITNKLTIMFIVITCAFVISYIPTSVLLIYVGIYPDYWEQLSGIGLSGSMFVRYIYILNNVINPFVYAFMDAKFKEESKQCLKKLFCYVRQNIN